MDVANDGFQQVGNKCGKGGKGNQTRAPEPVNGVILNKLKSKYFYRPKVNAKKVDETTVTKRDNTNVASTSKSGGKSKELVSVSNSFGVLAGSEREDGNWNNKEAHDIAAMESEDECENVYDETGTFMKPNNDSEISKGASTPVTEVPNV